MANEKFVRVASVGDVPENGRLCAEADGVAIALYNVGGKIYATQNVCTHAGGPLCEGKLDGDTVICPWHGSKFDVETGEVKGGPANVPIRTFPVEIRNEDIYVGAEGSGEEKK